MNGIIQGVRRGVGRVMLAAAVLLALSASVLSGPVDDIVAGVREDTYTHYHSDLLYTHYRGPGDYDNRGLGGAQHDPAQANIYSVFQNLGLATTLHHFTYGGGDYYNVVGVQTGLVDPGRIYVVGAHYDSVDNPGADDDASGVAAVMEAARVLSQHRFGSTLVFVAFDREEQGLLGSSAYAAGHAADDIRAMISLDMIAYNPPGPQQNQASIFYAYDNSSLTTELSSAMWTYGGISASIGQMGRSDHVPFDSVGFDACLLIERTLNPWYHQPADAVETPGLMDYGYAADMTRGTVGYLAGAAGPLPVPEPAGVIMVVWGMAALLFVRHRPGAHGRR